MDTGPAAIGRYQVRARLGQGGMGVLYLALDPAIDRLIALKLLRVDDDSLRERFLREARLAARLQHPNIVTIYDVGSHEGQPFIAMEYIAGETLAELIQRRAALSPLRKLELVLDACQGLAYAHKNGIVHRDIKPANLMVNRESDVLKVLDFGIARGAHSNLTQIGMLIGTPNYMAPEQVEGKPVDHRADVFALGLVLYELLVYRQAFKADTPHAVLHQVMHMSPTPVHVLDPGLDPGLATIIDKAIAKDAAARYPDLERLRLDLVKIVHRLKAEQDDETVIVADHEGETRLIAGAPSLSTHALDAERDAREIQAWMQKARALLEAGSLTSAGQAVMEALQIDRQHAGAQALRAEIDRAFEERDRQRERTQAVARALVRADESVKAGALDTALRATGEALGYDPGNADALAKRSQVLGLVDRRANAAIAEAREHIAAGRRDQALQRLQDFSPWHEGVEAALVALREELGLSPQGLSGASSRSGLLRPSPPGTVVAPGTTGTPPGHADGSVGYGAPGSPGLAAPGADGGSVVYGAPGTTNIAGMGSSAAGGDPSVPGRGAGMVGTAAGSGSTLGAPGGAGAFAGSAAAPGTLPGTPGGVGTLPGSAAASSTSGARRRSSAAIGGLAVVALIVGGSVIAWLQTREPQPQASSQNAGLERPRDPSGVGAGTPSGTGSGTANPGGPGNGSATGASTGNAPAGNASNNAATGNPSAGNTAGNAAASGASNPGGATGANAGNATGGNAPSSGATNGGANGNATTGKPTAAGSGNGATPPPTPSAGATGATTAPAPGTPGAGRTPGALAPPPPPGTPPAPTPSADPGTIGAIPDPAAVQSIDAAMANLQRVLGKRDFVGLDAIGGTLAKMPNTPKMHDALRQAVTQAEREADDARRAVVQAQPSIRGTAEFQRALEEYRRADRAKTGRHPVEAIRRYWNAHAQFTAIGAVAAAGSARPPATPPATGASTPASTSGSGTSGSGTSGSSSGTSASPPSAATPPPPTPPEAPRPADPTASSAKPTASPPASVPENRPPENRPVEPRPAVENHAAIQQTLDRFAAAYSTLKASSVRAVWVTMRPEQESSLNRAFSNMEQYTVTLSNCRISEVANGTRATADCARRADIRTKNGLRNSPADRPTFTLEKRGTDWVIIGVQLNQ